VRVLAICLLVLTLTSLAGYADKPAPLPGLKIDFALVDGNGNPYYVRPSDGKGALINGVDCTYAVLTLSGFNVYTNNQCSKTTPPQRFMEVNLASPAQGQSGAGDFIDLANFHTTSPGIGNMTAAGQTIDVDLAIAITVGSARRTTTNYKIRYGESGTPLALVTCVAASNNQCTQWTITPGGGTDLAEVFDDAGNNYGWFHIPFYMTITRQ